MKKIILVFLFLCLNGLVYSQTNMDSVIQSFVADLKGDTVSTISLIDKHFHFKHVTSQSEKERHAYPVISQQLELIRAKLRLDCPDFVIIGHDPTVPSVKAYQLDTDEYKFVYYLVCGDSIVTPLLLHERRILSISTYSKTKKGRKHFIIY